jgi:carbohydrate kinase (thermoresistant glucokinase family)
VNARRVVVMGVAGSGKSTLGAALASRRGARFLEADEFHSRANVAKMASGSPLTDDDRWPWLAALREAMRHEDDVVVACSALKRSYRDALRAAEDVRFVYLQIDRQEARRRLEGRPGHFMQEEMVDSQFAALEPPSPEEGDVVTLRAAQPIEVLTDATQSRLRHPATRAGGTPLLAIGSDAHAISADELRALVEEIAATHVIATGARRILLVPPDQTRLHSRAGEITAILFEVLTTAGCEPAVLPALGTHGRMTRDDVRLLFGDCVPFDRVIEHRWREGLACLGRISSDEVAAVSGGRVTDGIPVEVDGALLGEWDLVVSIGQVVPHEVVGMANFTKNLVIGLGGAQTIGRSHFLGAVCGLETIMGRAQTPVRDVVDAAFDRFVAPSVHVLWVLTVTEDTAAGVVHRGLFVGSGGSNDSGGAAFRSAAALSARCNITVLPQREQRVVCRLDPDEFKSTWLGNKAVYRTRMAIADGGELVVLAPSVRCFGEHPLIDELVRRHGYRGTSATLDAVAHDADLAASPAAAAHLIHGSSEGRFTITYCTDPSRGGLTREEIESVGYDWRPLGEEMERLFVADASSAGRRDIEGDPFLYVANPALGLWAAGTAGGA